MCTNIQRQYSWLFPLLHSFWIYWFWITSALTENLRRGESASVLPLFRPHVIAVQALLIPPLQCPEFHALCSLPNCCTLVSACSLLSLPTGTCACQSLVLKTSLCILSPLMWHAGPIPTHRPGSLLCGYPTFRKPTAHSTKFKGHFSCEACMGSTTQHPVSAACLSQLKWLFKLASMKVFLLLNRDYWFMRLFPRRGSKPLIGRKHVLLTVPMYQALDCSPNNRIPIICFVVLHACVCSCTCVLSYVWLFATPGTAARQAPLFMGFPRQAYCSGLPFPPPGDLSEPGMKPTSPALPLIIILKWNVRLWSTRKYFSLCPQFLAQSSWNQWFPKW